MKLRFSYTKSVGNHSFAPLAGMTSNSYRNDNVGGSKTNLLFNDFGHGYINNVLTKRAINRLGVPANMRCYHILRVETTHSTESILLKP